MNVFVVNKRAALCDNADQAFTSCAKEETCQRWDEVVELDVGEKHAVEQDEQLLCASVGLGTIRLSSRRPD